MSKLFRLMRELFTQWRESRAVPIEPDDGQEGDEYDDAYHTEGFAK